MQYRWEEIDQLADILEAEASGQVVDARVAHSLAQRLVELCPDIALSMRRVAERYSEKAVVAA